MDARHAKHRRATEAVEALWSEQESRDATCRISSASIKDSRDEVFQIANVLPQRESSEFLEPELSRMESRQTKGPVIKHLRELLKTAVELHQTKAEGGIIESPVDMSVSSRDGGTCMGGNGTCCGMITGVSCSVEMHGVSGS